VYEGKVVKPEVFENSFEQTNYEAIPEHTVKSHIKKEKENSNKLTITSESISKQRIKINPWIIVGIILGLLVIFRVITTGLLFYKVHKLKQRMH